MHRKFQVGCPCCCPDCSVYTAGPFSDLTGYTTIDGTWAVSSGAVYASAAPATLIGDTEAPSANMQASMNLPGWRGAIDGKFGVVISWSDSNNYLYAWAERIGGALGQYNVGITEVVGGVATDLDTTSNVGSAPSTVCAVHYQGAFLARFGLVNGNFRWVEGTVSDTSGLGKKAGVKTSIVLAYATGQDIDGWTVNTSGLYCENCKCNLVQFGTWVDQLSFDVSGVDCGGYYSGPDEVDGYYVIDYDEPEAELCGWNGYTTFPRGLSIVLGSVSDTVVSFTVTITSSTGAVTSATVYLPATCGRIDAAAVFATPIVLPLDFVTSDECDWSNATATIGAA